MLMNIGVVGSGQMGRGIAQSSLQSGHHVTLTDKSPDACQKASALIAEALVRLEKKNALERGTSEKLLANLKFGSELDELSSCNLIIEAVSEDSAIKLDVFQTLSRVANEAAILSSNTSSISITKLGAQTNRPEKVCGLHFMNPVPLMALVEIVPGLKTADHTCAQLEEFTRSLGKTAIYSKDYPGFLVNRILLPMINEAIWAVYEGIGSITDIDQAAKLGLNHPMGPLALADLIGLDTCLAILKVLHSEFGNPKYHPCPLLVKHVEAGHLGRKSGEGFYQYSN